ncbi:chromosome partitioning protein ParB [Methylomonas sp. Kb3]|uniref:ParB/RepB/Spo0J family partition protein n=1 Tax=Methylomonas sp. Kb3 TaxID=1611544 RepID=UPI000C349A33|nr:ParB/RepB/Spo0J family partition protein [Methylomonas sp. Kb3]PKD40496.1 chromosome partitioning protein ParB [Methylomonas sp. Kb3]
MSASSVVMSGGLGLEGIGDIAGLLSEPTANIDSDGRLLISIDLIDEDPNQPRRKNNPGFSKAQIEELAGLIQDRGVKKPISVRNHPDVPGRYMINDGARRFRASKLIGLTVIPAVIDNDFTKLDQLIANTGVPNTPMEWAIIIGEAVQSGMKKGVIAKKLEKTNGWVTIHLALLSLPKPLDDAYKNGRITDATIIYELVKIYDSHPDEVELWLKVEGQEFTRGQLALFREFIEEKTQKQKEEEIISKVIVPPSVDHSDESTSSLDNSRISHDKASSNIDDSKEVSEQQQGNNDIQGNHKLQSLKPADSAKFKKAIIQVEYDGRPARLLLDRRPSASGYAWLKYGDDGEVFEAALDSVRLIELIEG